MSPDCLLKLAVWVSIEAFLCSVVWVGEPKGGEMFSASAEPSSAVIQPERGEALGSATSLVWTLCSSFVVCKQKLSAVFFIRFSK